MKDVDGEEVILSPDLKEKNKGGRTSTYNEYIAQLICERIATHPIGLEPLCKLYDDMPAPCTIKSWRKQHDEFASMYLEAKAFQAQIMVEDIDDLIPIGIKYIHDEKGNERIDPPSASLVIAKINNRKWMAARLAPKIYGDRQEVEALHSENEQIKAELRELRAELAEQNKAEY